MSEHLKTEIDFDTISWHDNHVHALRVIEGEDGSGELVLDIDHIVEWIETPDGAFQFRILPVTLTFHGVMFLRLALDYASATAAFTPFMIEGIERQVEQRNGFATHHWTIPISWPSGSLAFEARGFTQCGDGEPIHTTSQCLTPEQRRREA